MIPPPRSPATDALPPAHRRHDRDRAPLGERGAEAAEEADALRADEDVDVRPHLADRRVPAVEHEHRTPGGVRLERAGELDRDHPVTPRSRADRGRLDADD